MTTHDTGGAPTQVDAAELAALEPQPRAIASAAIDGVHIVHRRPRFPVPGTNAEKRAERLVASCFALTFVAAVAFTVVYVVLPWQFSITSNDYAWFTPLLGLTMGLSLFGVGVGAVLWAKLLIPEEETVQDRHEGRSPELDRISAASTLTDGLELTGIARRSLLKRSLGLSGLGLGLLAVIPLGGLLKKPRGEMNHTPYADGVRLVTFEGRPVRPGDVLPGSQLTVFPGVPGGNRTADGPTLLIRLRPGQVVKARRGQESYGWNDYLAFSKICTHAGCPASLYEQETNRLLCPCHQSQFDLLQDAKPVFGPAARSLPKLPITVDDDGYFVARGDFPEPIGPSFWERG